MPRNLIYWALLSLLMFVFMGVSPIWAQDQTAQTTFTFTAHMEQAQKKMDLSKLYYNSFYKTKQYNYLKISANHNLEAVSTVNLVLTQISRNTRFYNIATSTRTKYCKSYERLRLISATLDPDLYLPGAPTGQCN